MTKELKVFEAFAGIGSQAKALENLGIPHKIVGLSEWDRYSMQAYAKVHPLANFIDYSVNLDDKEITDYLVDKGISNDSAHLLLREQVEKIPINERKRIYNIMKNYNNYGSIININPKELPDIDLFTYSFPCQDISINGIQRGLSKHSGTRSGLLWECEKIIKEKKPKYLMMENVKQLLSKKFINDWHDWVDTLANLGYTTYYKTINAVDYGAIQKRERVIGISILNEDSHNTFEFPTPITNKEVIKDILEPVVDDKYFHPQEYLDYFVNDCKHTVNAYNETHKDDMITLSDYLRLDKATQQESINQHKMITLGHYNHTKFRSAYLVFSVYGLASTLTTMQGGGQTPSIMVTFKNPPKNIPYSKIEYNNKETYISIRKITPLECWRLMGFSTNDFNNAKQTKESDSKLYKQAGDSIVVDVLMAIFRKLFIDMKGQD